MHLWLQQSSSMYGPVQDVRIPYQQKRMFGFVTFVYAESVRIILSKGNPHFVCDARVLVKPYKEMGKFRDRFRSIVSPILTMHVACLLTDSVSKGTFQLLLFLSDCRKLQHPHHGDFAGCTSPTGLLDSKDPFDLKQPQIGE